METLLREAVREVLEKYNVIKDNQHGFQYGRSCLTNPSMFFEDITAMIDKGNSVDAVYLNFQQGI